MAGEYFPKEEHDMPQDFKGEMLFNRSPETLLRLFSDRRFLEAEAKMQGCFEARCLELERTDSHIRLELEQECPNRDPRSRAPRSRHTISYDWNVARLRCTWSREPLQPDGVELGGEHLLLDTDTGGCRYVVRYRLKVAVPLLGRIFENKVRKALLEGLQRREAFARKWLAREALP